jgi:RNA polymerase-binding protein DksA
MKLQTSRTTLTLRSSLLAEREALLAHAREGIAQLTAHPLSEIAGDVPDEADASVAASLSDIENTRICREVARVCDIDGALARIDKREFGVCIDCGGTIARARLAAFPTATRCIECQKLHERVYAHAAMPTL